MTEASSSQSQEHPKRPPSPSVATYKKLPFGWKASEHHYFYGWAVTEDAIRKYLIKSGLRVPENDEILLASSAISDMERRRRSGFFDICIVDGKVDDEAIAQKRVIERESGPQLDLLAISCTRSKRLFRRRPLQSQSRLDILVQLLGEQPRWFEDFHTKANFVSAFMD